MRDYLNSNEKNQFMVLQSIVQMMDGLRNSGVNGPKISSMLEDWTKRDNMTKAEHKNLKTSETFLRKFLASVYERLNSKEQDVIKKKLVKFDFKLIDDYTLKQIDRDIKDKITNAVLPRQQFYDWSSEIMAVKCNGCTQEWNTCQLHQVFDDNLVPESGFDCKNCKFAYTTGE
ncbi:DUF5651 domain-containing protein [Mesobacillus stamsii]|uniref:DUF5651 domain-containing protein n=1 Tax=Mesobacillus stamsii TaxID=225347 RepID=A0ABU0FSK0_9BACI|nr:DUF5651 domain-containing protein [Mesobacillus stamsii]MDQ0412705.1 hypothetical protein [Mesobacillus stamsii]